MIEGEASHVLAHSAGLPLGPSIEGRRVAWAEDVNGHGRILSLTLR
jgi:hypothetical protein